MTTENFQPSLARVLVHEGGYVNDPDDPGGATNRGITQRVYDAYRKRLKLSPRPVKQANDTEVNNIYHRQYWARVRGDDLPLGVDYVVFDGAVHSGPSQSAKWLQRALGVRADGVIGDVTLAAAEAHPDHDALIADIVKQRGRFLTTLKGWKKYGKGWSRRLDEVEEGGQAWASGSRPAPASFIDGINRRADPADAKRAPSTAPGDAAVGAGGTAAVGGVVALDQAREALEPLTGTSQWIDTAIAVLVLAGVVLAVGGLAYRLYARARAARIEAA